MNLRTLTSQQFRQIAELLQKREKIIVNLNRIENELSRLDKAGVKKKSLPKVARSTGKLSLKDEVLQTLAAAGEKGLRIGDLAATVKRTPTHLSVWFSTVGRKVKGLKRVGYGQYAYLPKGE